MVAAAFIHEACSCCGREHFERKRRERSVVVFPGNNLVTGCRVDSHPLAVPVHIFNLYVLYLALGVVPSWAVYLPVAVGLTVNRPANVVIVTWAELEVQGNLTGTHR